MSNTTIDIPYVETTLFDRLRKRQGWSNEFLRQLNQTCDITIHDELAAAELLHTAYTHNLTVTIITDFDMDGITSGTIAYAGLNELGITTHLAIPDYTGPRHIQPSDIDTVKNTFPDTDIILTCDSGTTAHDALHYAHTQGLYTIVTDHHVPENTLPPGLIVNPHCGHEKTPTGITPYDICGAQTVFHLLQTYTATYRHDKLPLINLLEAFAGMGAVADMMPVAYNTRQTIRRSLHIISTCMPSMTRGKWDSFYTGNIDPSTAPLVTVIKDQVTPEFYDAFYGLATLLSRLIVAGKIKNFDYLDYSFFGFTLSPMFNAIRRVEADMSVACSVFTPRAMAEHNAGCDPSIASDYCINVNQHRKEIVTKLTHQLKSSEQPAAPYVWIAPYDTPPGVLGLVANTLCQASGLPTCVVTPNADGSLSGSSRSPKWCDMIDQSLTIPEMSAAGHQQACGVFFESNTAIINLCQRIVDITPKTSDVKDTPAIVIADSYKPVGSHCDINMALGGKAAEDEVVSLITLLDSVQPFGVQFPYPDIAVTVNLDECVIDTLKGKHLKITTPSGMQLLQWNNTHCASEGVAMFHVTLEINNFNGSKRIQGIINHAN